MDRLPENLLYLLDHPSLIKANISKKVATVCIKHEGREILVNRLRGKIRIVYDVCDKCKGN